MKKVFSFILILCVSYGSQAQDKKFRAGLVAGTTVTSLKVQTNKVERDGVGNGFTIGMAGDYRINNNIAFSSGIQFDLESFSLTYGSATNPNLGNIFYGYNDTEIFRYKDGAVSNYADTVAFQLMSRTFNAKYITIPLFLKFQTNMIGSFSYYGKFGVRPSILAGIRMEDEGFDAKYDPNTGFFESDGTITTTLSNMKPEPFKKGLALARIGVGVYGGTEWNFTGNTFLFGEFGFNYGVTPALYQKSSHLVEKIDVNGTSTYENLDVKSNPQHIFELKIGLLF